MRHTNRPRQALAHLAESDLALAALALWRTHLDDSVDTRTQGETIRYGPGFDLMPLAEQVGVVAHHVLHVALRHGARGQSMAERMGPGFDPDLFGLAADAIVSETLFPAGHPLPRPCVRVTELLAAVSEPLSSPNEAMADWAADRLALRLHRDPQTRQATRDHARSRAFRLDVAPGDAGQTQQDPVAWAGHMERALGLGRDAGTGIGMLTGRPADLSPPRLPWEHLLRGLLVRALIEAPHSSWRRPSGRWAARHASARAGAMQDPAFEPGRQRMDHVPRIVVGVDTSSSIEPVLLSLFSAEICAVATPTAAETWRLAVDEAIHEERRLAHWNLSELDRIDLGSGVTDLTPPMDRGRDITPSVVVVLTDLDGDGPPAPACPVIWVMPDGPRAPPYGTLLTLSP